MSYWASLCDPVTGETLNLDAPHHMRGGTYCLGGTNEASLNVTYNYSRHYSGLGPDGLRSLHGMTGAASLPLLRATAAALGDDVDPDYWKPTEGNAKRALLQLAALAEMRPDGVWNVD